MFQLTNMLIYLIFFIHCIVLSKEQTIDYHVENITEGNSRDIISPVPLQLINSSSESIDIMENQLQDQLIVTNTSLNSLQNDNSTQKLQIQYRQRKRQERLYLIQSQILRRLGITRRNNMTNSNINTFSDEERSLISKVVEQVSTSRTVRPRVTGVNQILPSEVFAERLQSFYTSCSTHNHHNHTHNHQSGNDSSTEMRLFFDLTFPKSSASCTTEINIVNAKIRLFKYNDPPIDVIPIQNLVIDNVSSQQGLIISIHQNYKRRHSKKDKKRLLESKTIPVSHRGWIEFNVTNTVNQWKQRPFSNNGFSVEIEDSAGNKLNPPLYIRKMNCSINETPFPNIMDLYPDANATMFDTQNYPTLDLFTVEISKNVSPSDLRRKRHTKHYHHQKYYH